MHLFDFRDVAERGAGSEFSDVVPLLYPLSKAGLE
jgi:hypothetical protein